MTNMNISALFKKLSGVFSALSAIIMQGIVSICRCCVHSFDVKFLLMINGLLRLLNNPNISVISRQ